MRRIKSDSSCEAPRYKNFRLSGEGREFVQAVTSPPHSIDPRPNEVKVAGQGSGKCFKRQATHRHYNQPYLAQGKSVFSGKVTASS